MAGTNRPDGEILTSLSRQTINNAWYTASPDGCEDGTLVLELDDGREVRVRAYAPHDEANLYLEEFVPGN